MIILEKKGWLKFYSRRYLKRITDPKLRGADCKSAPAALNIVAVYPEELGNSRIKLYVVEQYNICMLKN